MLAALTALPAVPACRRLRRLVVSRETVELDFLSELLEPSRPCRTGCAWCWTMSSTWRAPQSHGLEMLARRAPRGLRLVLSGRRDPALPLPRLRMEERLHEVRNEQLLFTHEETTALMELLGLRLTPAQVALLQVRTGGWIAGLRLAAMSLNSHPDPDRFLAEFSGDERSVADYLVDEVLTGLEASQRETLRRVSVAEALPGGLAVELADREDASDVLDELVRRTGLVTGTGAPGAEYRIAELLRSQLVADLRRHRPDLAAQMHRRAALWWSGEGRPREALAHAERVGDPGFLADLLAGWAPHLAGTGEHDALERALAMLDADPVAADARIAVAAAHVHLERGSPEELRAALRRARRAGRAEDGPGLGCHAVAFRTATERLAGVPRPVTTREPAVDDPALCTLGLVGRGTTALVSDDAERAVDELGHGLELARGHGLSRLEIQARCLLSAALWSVGDIRRAATTADAALLAVAGWEDSPWATVADAVAAHVGVLRGDPPPPWRPRCTSPATWSAVLPPVLRYALRSARGSAMFDVGDQHRGLLELPAARAELGNTRAPAALEVTAALSEHRAASLLRYSTAASSVAAWLAARRPGCPELRLLRGWTAGLAGNHREARNEVAPLIAGGLRPNPAATVVEAWLLEARGLLAEGSRPGARYALRSALHHAVPLDAHRPFVHAGQAVRALLVDQPIGGGNRDAFVARTLAAAPDRHTPAARELSTREHDVLARLRSLESLDEIAEGMGISINTIKTHVRSIYGKLGVGTRREALRTAHEQGLLR